MTTDYVSEWYRCATHAPYPVTRRQIVEVPGGYQLTPVELVGTGPESLRDYDGGWQFPTKLKPTLAAAERHLTDNGYTREMPTVGTPPATRKRSGTGGQSTVPQRAVRMPAVVRRELMTAVKAGHLGRIPRKGLGPEIFFHPDHLHAARERQKSEMAYAVSCIKGVVARPLEGEGEHAP